MDFRKFINKSVADKSKFLAEQTQSQENAQPTTDDKNADAVYYNMVDPETNLRYDIPLVSPLDPSYYFKYVYYMKLKESSPETFKKIMNWE